MIELKTKPNAAQTLARFEAWWQCEVLDRPLIHTFVKPTRPCRLPVKQHASAKERWLDSQFQVECAIARIESADYAGDHLPSVWCNVGPEISATLYGAPLGYLDDATAWSEPIVHELADWEKVLARQPDFTNEFWRSMERTTDLLIAANDNRYLVGMTDLHGNYDILAALRDPQMLCLDLLDDPQLIQRVGRHVATGFVAAFNKCYQQVRKAGFGSTSWTPMYHDGPAYIPSCDFWCMVSPQIARDLILPDIVHEMQPLARSIFHLDGPQALQHLDLLLELPQLNAVQWVYGAGNGPAARWIDVYQRCQRAGKAIQVNAESCADALTVAEQLDPRGLWIYLGEAFADVASAEAFIREYSRRCGTRR